MAKKQPSTANRQESNAAPDVDASSREPSVKSKWEIKRRETGKIIDSISLQLVVALNALEQLRDEGNAATGLLLKEDPSDGWEAVEQPYAEAHQALMSIAETALWLKGQNTEQARS